MVKTSQTLKLNSINHTQNPKKTPLQSHRSPTKKLENQHRKIPKTSLKIPRKYNQKKKKTHTHTHTQRKTASKTQKFNPKTPSIHTFDTHFHDKFCTNPIQPSSTSLWAQFMYYIIFYSFKHDPSSCDLWGKLRKCGLEGMGRFLLDFFHKPNTYVLPSRQGILIAP